jgi:LCP family protein required for cell wall assembly
MSEKIYPAPLRSGPNSHKQQDVPKRCEVNFLEPSGEEYKQPEFKYREIGKISGCRKALFYLIGFMIVLMVFFTSSAIFSDESVFSNISTNIKKLNIFSQLPKLLTGDEEKLKGYSEDRINFILLGMGGFGHDGPLLTDTMILASYQPSTNKVAMLSIPRDLLVKVPNYGWGKINNVNAYAEVAQAGSGSQVTANVVSEIFNIPIHYYARIDFAGFEKLVDDMGGLDIYVERSFIDYQYPAKNYGYQTVSFKNGWQHMNGDQALKYARSRHGNNGEGSDFARSLRQQKILLALKEKILSFNTIFNAKKLNSLLSAYNDNVQTNIEIWEALALKKLAENFEGNIINQILDTSPENYLFESIVGGAYVLQPKAGDWSDLRFLAANIFDQTLTAKENATIEVLNGTKSTGLALNTGLVLQNFGYDVIRMRNAKDQTYKKTVIYDLSNGSKKKTLSSLKNKFKATITTSLPPWLEKWRGDEWDGEGKIFTKADIVVVAGQDIIHSITNQIEIWRAAQESDQEEEILEEENDDSAVETQNVTSNKENEDKDALNMDPKESGDSQNEADNDNKTKN